MFSTKRLLLRGIDPAHDANDWLQLVNNSSIQDTASAGPHIPASTAAAKGDLEARYGLKGTSKLPCFIISLKDDAPETAWPNTLKPGDDYFATAPPSIGVVDLQGAGFNYKNRVAYVGILFHRPEHRNKGYGTEVLQWMVQYAFEDLGLHKLDLVVYENNPAGIRCYEKVGFVEEGRHRKEYWHAGQWLDVISMGILEETYFEKKRANVTT